jgi:hypothetical protein
VRRSSLGVRGVRDLAISHATSKSADLPCPCLAVLVVLAANPSGLSIGSIAAKTAKTAKIYSSELRARRVRDREIALHHSRGVANDQIGSS